MTAFSDKGRGIPAYSVDLLVLNTVKKKAAYTLAEVLITLGIIGVVAALTMPALLQHFEKKTTLTKLKKAISVLNQAYSVSFYEYGEPDDSFNQGGKAYFEKYWAPYLKVSKYCNTYADCGYTKSNPWTYPNKNNTGVHVIYGDFGRTIYSPEGFVYMIRVKVQASNTTESKLVIVDINGGQGPNVYGKDVFFLERDTKNGIIQPVGYNMDDNYVKNNCTKSCCQVTSTCAEKIRRDGWEIKNDYPW